MSDAVDTAADTQTHFRTCPLCEATCGLEITTRGDEVVRIRGDRDDVFSHGFICPKGSTLKQLHTDPDRLRSAQIRSTGDDGSTAWTDVGWDEAFAEIERRLMPIIEEHGRNAVAVYLGNPTVHNLGAGIYARALLTALGTSNIYSASTVDQMPRHVSCGAMYGSPDAIPVPDLDRTDHLLMLGANPYESNGSLCTAPDFPGRLEAIRERGGKVVVVDPRLTKTAKNADEHIPIRPGTDGHLLLAMAHVLFAEDLIHAELDPAVYAGLDAVRDAVEPFSPETVATHTGIDADTIRRMSREVAAAPSAAVYGRIGTNTVAFGSVSSWASDLVTSLTGNLDRPGGMMFPLPLTGARGSGKGRGFATGRSTSRVKGHPEVRSEFPIATLADEIETPGDGQVRALITVGGNPARSAPNSTRLEAALASLEFMVSIDPYRNETTRHADVVLPPPDALEKSHYDLAFTTLSVRNVANYSPAVFEPNAEQLAEHTILSRLALVLSGMGATADPAVIDGLVLDRVLSRATKPGGVAEGRTTADLVDELVATDGPEQVVEAMVRTGAYGDGFGADPEGVNFQTLLDHPHGVDLGPLQPRLPEVLKTPSGQVEMAPPAFLADLPRLLAAMAEPRNGHLTLIGRRHVRSNNSWMHNVDVLVKGKNRCTLQVHPDDATRLGLIDGGDAEVSSRVGKVVAPVEVTDEILAGVVSLPHGWGHDDPGTLMAVATAHSGVNTNVLTDDGALDPLSGNAVLNGVPVSVAPA